MRIGIIGFGEVGRIVGAALVQQGVEWVGTYDILLADPNAAGAI